MVDGTYLLVIVTLLNAINNDLPKTSYVKLIDIWFVWHITSIFAMIIYHIMLDIMRKHFEKTDDDRVHPFTATEDEDIMETDGTNKIRTINNNTIMAFPIVNSVFYGIYFYLTLN